MVERPMLFSAPMVRAILSGAKTQTRRVVKPRKCPDFGCELAPCEIAGEKGEDLHRLCPYGQPGDRLWVREAWLDMARPGYKPVYAYRAELNSGEGFDVPPGVRWRPSIHMPRAASRITLEITGVRVERLQAISEADAIAEGVPNQTRLIGHSAKTGCAWGPPEPIAEYCTLWESINGPDSWAANPWVWVVEFKRAA